MLQTLLLPLEQFRNYCGLAFTAIAKLLDGLQTAVCQARRAPLLLAVTTSRWFITQGLWRIPAEEISSFQAAILQELFHRFFRGRDSMKGNKVNRR
jgi:hypothetical protein